MQPPHQSCIAAEPLVAMTTHLPAACDATSYMQGSTVSEDNVVRCPVSHVSIQSTGLQTPRTLSCCGAICCHWALEMVLCSKQVPCCPICGSILPFHNSCDYPLDYDTINKLKAFSSPAIPRDGSEFNSARERLRNDRTVRTSTEPCTTPHSCNLLPTHLLVQAPVDLFVAAEFFNTTEEKKALTPALTPAQLTREQNRKAGEVRERVAATRAPDVLGQGSAGQSTAWDASQGRDLSVHVLHAHPGPQQHKLKPTERLLCIPPRGFILKISRGMLIGRLREMIASKMGVSCKAVQLKLLSQHTLCTPQSKTSSIPSAYCAHEKAVEKSGAVCGGQAPFSSVQKAHTMSNTSALTKAESHGASSAPHAGILPGADSNCKKNERTLEGQGARSMLDPAAPMWKCKPAESSQAGRRPIHLQEWQPSCPSVPCQATGQGQPANGETPPRPGKHTLGAIAGNPIREIRSSMDLSSNKNSLGRREDLQSSRVGQHLSTVDDNSESGLVDAVSATSATETFGSAGTGVESHRLSRLSSCTCTSSNDSWETTRGSGTASGSGTEAGNVPDQPKHMESLKRLRVGKSVHCMPTYKDALTNLKGKMDISSHASTAEHDVSTPLSTAALSLLSEATATSEQLSVGCEHAVDTEQGNYRQACSSSYPSGPVAPENLLECFERGSASERLEPGWNSVMLHSACTDLEDDEKSLWDHDGRDRCIGVWKDAAGNWLLAAFKPPTTEQIDNCEKLMPVPLEAVGGAVCGKLHSRVLLQVSIDMDKIPQADRATLQHALQLQQVACALQQCGRNNTQHAFRRVPQEACQASRRPMPLCGFPFQERICLALVPQEPNTARSSSRSYASVAAAGHVIPEEDVCMAEHGYLSSLQKVGKSRVTARWNDVQRDSMMWGEPLVGGSVALFVGTGNLSTRLQGPNSSR